MYVHVTVLRMSCGQIVTLFYGKMVAFHIICRGGHIAVW